jgi:hypothetical protein
VFNGQVQTEFSRVKVAPISKETWDGMQGVGLRDDQIAALREQWYAGKR